MPSTATLLPAYFRAIEALISAAYASATRYFCQVSSRLMIFAARFIESQLNNLMTRRERFRDDDKLQPLSSALFRFDCFTLAPPLAAQTPDYHASVMLISTFESRRTFQCRRQFSLLSAATPVTSISVILLISPTFMILMSIPSQLFLGRTSIMPTHRHAPRHDRAGVRVYNFIAIFDALNSADFDLFFFIVAVTRRSL